MHPVAIPPRSAVGHVRPTRNRVPSTFVGRGLGIAVCECGPGSVLGYAFGDADVRKIHGRGSA